MKERTLRMFLYLYRKRKCTYKEIAQECECSARTVMRDIDEITPIVPLIVVRGCKGG